MDDDTSQHIEAYWKHSNGMTKDHIEWAETIIQNEELGVWNYFQIRSLLPEQIREEIDGILSIDVPNELDRIFDTRAEFLDVLQKIDISLQFDSMQVEKVAKVIDIFRKEHEVLFEELTHGRKISLARVGVLDACVGYTFRRGVDPHFTITQYLYDRAKLPSELTEEFESEFHLEIPEWAEDIKSYDAFLSRDDADMRAFLDTHVGKLREMIAWLRNKLEEYSEKSHEILPKPTLRLPEEALNDIIGDLGRSPDEVTDIKKSYTEMMSLRFRKSVEDMFHIRMEHLSMQEQLWFLSFLRDKDKKMVEQVQTLTQVYGSNFLQLFLSIQYERSSGDHVVNLFSHLKKEDGEKILHVYTSVYEQIGDASLLLADEYGEGLSMSFADIQQALAVRAKDLVMGVHIESQGVDQKVIDSLCDELGAETPDVKVLSGFFRKIADSLGHHEAGTLDLASFQKGQDRLLESLRQEQKMGLFNRALAARGELAPIPEIHWRVDRGNEEYTRRFGFDLFKLLDHIKDPKRKKVLLEFGPGSGKSKQERAEAGFDEYYLDMAMANKVYYPLNKFIEGVIDWGALEQEIGPLTVGDREVLSDMMYKTLMISDGETSKNNFSYAHERIEQLTKDPSSLRNLLSQIAPSFGYMVVIPDTISTRDDQGNVIYPYKINLTAQDRKDLLHAEEGSVDARSNVFLKAKQLLAEDIQKYFWDGEDLYDAIPAYTSGIMVGDFSRIEALKDGQIDVAIGVRSTVYKRGDEYIQFLEDMSQKLKEGGIYIDDSIRDNDGWTYRIAEMLQARQSFPDGISLTIIIGPGFQGEDAQKGDVPLGFVMQKDVVMNDEIQSLLQGGYTLYDFDEYIKRYVYDGAHINQKTLMQLDDSGHLYETVSAFFPSGEVRVAA
ncbi:MAG: hypothetical protein CO030_01385 [Candidatus Magasanikbacteria bacterium CG_4_9_14_0_2_um_filter_42_11]|uniref:Uncharacterized protein n=1 Tax=Candidatus Magasanikbacteria bacterium CG_4_9_14_0_2_um_filter_42_11 TaxID=1974643 RepID=A0A2M8FAG0_9BACT|nr:MAG: hypothetical protein COU34_01220 [Candidatus Magasanikbacteria bacterium CG10_big_fil_rev_8_21_14_0_10_43_9]PJC52723.1 MAG: hypothetical protein CO030_01385 [Candidatus Magasanikbacteria bacterium CG_4_9_14_0_2_um_filter_42_11]